MAAPFIYTNPEAARQAIAERQLQAALAENASREAIAHEQTQQARYATQSNINEREKDRQVSREDIAARYGYNSRAQTDKDARERSSIQFNTLRDKILHNQADPPTKGELETWLSKSPELTKDLMNDLRSLRDDAYNAAKANAVNGKQSAANYTSRLAEFAKSKFPQEVAKAKESLLNKISGDKDVIYDASTGMVVSKWKMPREDGAATAGMGADYRPGGVFPSASEMQRAGRPTAQAPTATSGIPTIGDMQARVTGVPAGPAFTETSDALPPTQATITASAPAPAQIQALRPVIPPMSFGGGFAVPNRITNFRMVDIAPPADVSIPAPQFAVPRRMTLAPGELYGPPNRSADVNSLIDIARHPSFNTLAPEDQQFILNEIGNAAQRMPRVSDMQDYSPPPPYYQ